MDTCGTGDDPRQAQPIFSFGYLLRRLATTLDLPTSERDLFINAARAQRCPDTALLPDLPPVPARSAPAHPLPLQLPAQATPLIGRERAAAIYALDAASPIWRLSPAWAPFRAATEARLSAALAPEALAAALQHGRGQDRWASARALLDELERLGWG